VKYHLRGDAERELNNVAFRLKERGLICKKGGLECNTYNKSRKITSEQEKR
jgi:hypothetical protein